MAVRAAALAYSRYRSVVVSGRVKLGPTDGAALSQLHLDGPQTPSQLATWLNITTGAVTELLDRLQNAGYITRTPHPTDRRRVIVSLTEDARELIENELLAPLSDALAPVLTHHDPDTQDGLINAVNAAAAALDKAIIDHRLAHGR